MSDCSRVIARGGLFVLPLATSARPASFAPSNNEGHGAPRGANVLSRFRHRLRRGVRPESASPHGAPFAAIFEPGTVLPGEDGGEYRPLIRQAFACLRPLLVQPRTAEPRSWPGRSTPAFRTQRVRTVHADAASCSASKAPSRSAPHEQDMPNISAVKDAGIDIPITKCCSIGSPDIFRRHSGARAQRASPESTAPNEIYARWIPGLRQAAHPGMTVEHSCASPPARGRRG
jgi:hypothetical protein